MGIIIRSAEQDDCAKIRPLQKEIADLHHAGRPDLFREEARYYSDEDFAGMLKESFSQTYTWRIFSKLFPCFIIFYKSF